MLTCSRYACISAGEKLRKNQEAKAGDTKKTVISESAAEEDKTKMPATEEGTQNEKSHSMLKWVKKYTGL